MKNNLMSAVIILSMSAILVSCSQSPEDYGKKLAEKGCDCLKESIANKETKVKQILSDLKEGKYKTASEARKTLNAFYSSYDSPSDATKKCYDEFHKMDDDTKVKFAKDEDRKTVFNAYSANSDACRQENYKTLNGLEKELEPAIQKLPQ